MNALIKVTLGLAGAAAIGVVSFCTGFAFGYYVRSTEEPYNLRSYVGDERDRKFITMMDAGFDMLGWKEA